VLDLDGTLVDTAPDLTHALNHVLIKRGLSPMPIEAVRSAVGYGARVMIEQSLRALCATGDIDEMLAEFLVHYEANIAADSRPFPGAIAALDGLAHTGARLAICTNKRESLSRKLLKELELEDYFASVAGRDTFPVSKPDPAHLTGTIALAGGRADCAVMVGDSHIDINTAKAAHVPIVWVSFGYASGPIDDLRPEAVIDHFDALPEQVFRLLGVPAASRRPV
jgi:phosphoglycolate phosphatase